MLIVLLISDLVDRLRRLAGRSDDNRNRFRWEFRFHWRLRPFFEADSFMDGGTKFWSVGPFSLYRWYVHAE